MSKAKSGAPGADAYISLHAAFQALGEALFKDDWKEDCWRLGPGPFPEEYEGPSLYDPKLFRPDERDEIEAIGEAVSANDMQCRSYYDTMKCLRDGIWFQEFGVAYIPLDEKQSDIGHTAWRDESGSYQVSIPLSRIYRKRVDRVEKWDVKIENSRFNDFVGHLKIEKAKENRIIRAVESRSPNKDSHTFDPDSLTELVGIVYSDATGTISNNEWARRVERILRSHGKTVNKAPGLETILRSIRKYKKRT
jgi:hypothetical protein